MRIIEIIWDQNDWSQNWKNNKKLRTIESKNGIIRNDDN